MSTLTSQVPLAIPDLNPREAVLDAAYRLLRGLDTNNTTFFNSGMHPDCTFTIGDQTLTGRDAIYKDNLAQISRMNTSHMLANPRVAFNEEMTEAQLSVRALTMHYPAGEGFGVEGVNRGERRFLVCSWYDMEVVRSVEGEGQGLWQVKRWVLTPSWAEGEASVMPA